MALAMLLALAFAWPRAVSAFDRFADLQAEAVFGEHVTFSVELEGSPPDELELLLRFADDDAVLVQPVDPVSGRVQFAWDTRDDYISPNTPIRYQWRATEGDNTLLSEEATILYDDDRSGLDWQVLEVGGTRVHWYDEDRRLAEEFGAISAGAVDSAQRLFGSALDGPVDVFAYRSQEEFTGALGPGSREWVGGQTSPEIRTVYIWLEAGPREFMEPLLVHEITHMVFADATDNPYHRPARWLNEGLAVWSETRGADNEWSIVSAAADDGELMAFDAIAEQFPTDAERAGLAYAQGAVLVDQLIERHGEEAIGGIVAAYREGATDAEAIEAGTGVPLDGLVEDWFGQFGQGVPEAVEPDPLPPAVGGLPPGVVAGEPPVVRLADPGSVPSDAPGDAPGWMVPVAAAAAAGVVVVLVAGGLIVRARRRARGVENDGPS